MRPWSGKGCGGGEPYRRIQATSIVRGAPHLLRRGPLRLFTEVSGRWVLGSSPKVFQRSLIWGMRLVASACYGGGTIPMVDRKGWDVLRMCYAPEAAYEACRGRVGSYGGE